jgi:hypothetical protein
VPIKTAIGVLSTHCIKNIVGFYYVPDTDTDYDSVLITLHIVIITLFHISLIKLLISRIPVIITLFTLA